MWIEKREKPESTKLPHVIQRLLLVSPSICSPLYQKHPYFNPGAQLLLTAHGLQGKLSPSPVSGDSSLMKG